MNDRVIVQAADRAVRPIGMAPVGAAHADPPVADVVQVDGSLRLDEDQRVRLEELRQGAPIVARVERHLGNREVPRCFEEFLVLRIRHRVPIDPEAADLHAMDGRFLGIVALRPHQKGAALDPDHSGLGSACGRLLRQRPYRKLFGDFVHRVDIAPYRSSRFGREIVGRPCCHGDELPSAANSRWLQSGR